MNRRKPGWPLALILCLTWLAVLARPVSAHAELVRSDPANGAALAAFPTTVTLTFSEAVDAAGLRARLLNDAGQVITEGQPTLDPKDATIVHIQLPAQPDGLYTIAWAAVSADDDHGTEGTISFSAGASAPRASLLPPPGANDQSTTLPAAPEILLRWLGYLTLSLLIGSALFGALVWRPVYRRAVAQPAQPPTADGSPDQPAGRPETGDQPPGLPAEWDDLLTTLTQRVGLAAAILAILTQVGLIIYNALKALADPSVGSFWLGLEESLGHHGTSLFWVNLGVLMLVALLVNDLPSAGAGLARSWWEVAVISGVVAFTSALFSHNAALGGWVPIAVDWLHLTAMAAWVGGLLPLAVLLARARRCAASAADGSGEALAARELAAGVLRRFSRLALSMVILIALTGLYSAYFQVKTLAALVSTRYGQALLLKTGLFGLLIAFGALNQRGLIPRVSRPGSGALRRISQTVRAEYVVGLALLLVVGALVSMSPAYSALQTDLRAGYHQAYRQGAVQLDLRIAPAKPGEDEFGVDITDRRPGAGQAASVVLLRIQPADGSVNAAQVEADHTFGSRYTARGLYFVNPTAYEVEVTLRKPGFKDVSHTFTVDLPRIAAQRAEGN